MAKNGKNLHKPQTTKAEWQLHKVGFLVFF